MSVHTPKHALTAELAAEGDLPPLKPGPYTSEFWLTVLTTVASLAVALGWIGPNFVHDHAAAVNAVAILAATIAPAAYAIARGITKGKHQAAAAHLAAMRALPLPEIQQLP